MSDHSLEGLVPPSVLEVPRLVSFCRRQDSIDTVLAARPDIRRTRPGPAVLSLRMVSERTKIEDPVHQRFVLCFEVAQKACILVVRTGLIREEMGLHGAWQSPTSSRITSKILIVFLQVEPCRSFGFWLDGEVRVGESVLEKPRRQVGSSQSYAEAYLHTVALHENGLATAHRVAELHRIRKRPVEGPVDFRTCVTLMHEVLKPAEIHKLGRSTEVKDEATIRCILRLLEEEQKLQHAALAGAVLAEETGHLAEGHPQPAPCFEIGDLKMLQHRPFPVVARSGRQRPCRGRGAEPQSYSEPDVCLG